MYQNRKGAPPTPAPSDAQAREKLALYVYEYLQHTGAKQAAETFLKEINWSKNISLGDPPGFLHSWWCVFWDLYCAAPERRDNCDSSQEAKAFHDYSQGVFPGFPPQVNGIHGQPNTSGSPMGMGGGGGEGIVGGHPGMPGPGHPFFGAPRPSPPHSQPSPHAPPPGPYGAPRPGFPPPPGSVPGPRMVGAGNGPRMSQGDPGFGAPGVMMPQQRLPPSGAPHPRMPPTPLNSFRPGHPPQQRPTGPPWPPSTSAGGGMMSNGPMGAGAMPSPQTHPPGPEGGERYLGGGGPRSVGGDGGPGSVPSTAAESQSNGAEAPSDVKNSPASAHGLNGGPGTPGPGSRAASGGPGSVPSSAAEPMEFAQSQAHPTSKAGFPPTENFEQSEIANIKERLMDETKHHLTGSGPAASAANDEFF